MALSKSVEDAQKAVNKFVSGFTSGQKVLTIIGVAAVVVGSFFLMRVTSSPSYAPLFTNLSASDAAAITQKLTAASVPYQLTNGGSTIMVPQSEVYQERIDMAQVGLPQNSTVGLSLLDKVGITSSQITQQADYQRALQGELATTIEAIQGVTSAQVNLALPPTDVFAISQNQSPSASVLVTLASGVSLSPTQTQAIVHLVASSIPNMSASDVTVVDQNGDVLAAPGFNNTASMNSSATSQFNTELGASLTSMLQNVLGPNHVAVKVAAQLNFNQATTNSQSIQTTPKGTPVTAPTQSSTTKQTYTGTGTAPGGVLGTITQPVTGGNQNSNYSQTQTTNSYAIGQVNQTVKQAPGQIQRLSVAVLVDSKVKGVSLASIKSLVSAAAGLVAARGDTISVVKMPFAAQTQALSSASSSSSQLSSLLSLAKTIALALAILIVVFLLLRSSKSEEREDLFVRELDTEPLNLAALNAGPSVPAISMPKHEEFIAEEVFDFIDQQPEDVAKLLRIWMSSRSR